MTDIQRIDPGAVLSEHLAAASPDLLRGLLSTFVQTLMSAEADAVCGAGYGERSDDRVNSRNGYRHRDFDTRVGTIDVAIPKLRSGSYFPDWLLERRKRAERALTSVVATCYLLGVSTRRMEKLVESLGITTLSKSQVSMMARDLDAQVEAFRTRPLDQGPYTFVAADALVLKVRENGRVVNVHALIATGVNNDGYREILGLQVTSGEDGAGWLAFFRDLVARGLAGVKLVTSDAHAGLVAAIGATLPGAAWQRCRTHYTVNLMSVCPKSSWPWVRTLLHSVFDQADPESVAAQYDRMLDALAEKLPTVADHLDAARADLLAFTAFPKQIWRQIWSNNPQERLNKEIRRRTDVVGIFPDRGSIIRLVGAVLAEQHDEWIEGRRYLGLDVLARSRDLTTDEQEDTAPAELTA
ncbi:Transposase and inactivated derivatives [Nocardia otitidiscaviarum]|uniref:Mutator family transposase n=1 Tax=Nocardia otitidiscaviarum TaxID=1823 RepID=A0A379JHD7_9NOCA|nr:IS256 family transposase [Nocardia otitidiscaviarum]MBF6183601.1 IS256 family transposase [Nocardia otitidiscaviarum]SUA72848.1 Transposase and inactivated derivatives [Nocardia otitidiscaviarum]SUD47885.1 Transposase and inactivated derivatives [Nocardia otitidiscaviarum]SUD48873.1 Transposase and inactivated derivatives [Nocardia otitidiscaviarum]